MRRENELALLRAEMRVVRQICGVKLSDKVACEEVRDRLGLEDVVTVFQHNRLRSYGHVLRKDDSEWVKKCMLLFVEGVRPRDRTKRTWKEVVEGDMKSLKLSKEDALVLGKWRRLIRGTVEDSDDSGG